MAIVEMIKLYKKYGFNPPIKGKYKRDKNRIYFSDDFKDNEEIYFFWNCEKSSSCSKGNVFYKNEKGNSNLINILEIELEVENNEV